ncbi:MAG: DUF2780 domain-containing protein [Ignavibacteria bacterium]|nr:DUF2780 domain-containing protein [Ignavibacteria bacterium]
MKNRISSVTIVVLALVLLSGCSGSKSTTTKSKTGKDVSSGLTSQVSKTLGITESQTEAGLGAMMMLSKDKLSPDDFSKLTKDLPGGSDLISKATDLGVVPGSVSTTADILKVLNKLGISPVTAAKFVPTVLSAAKSLGGGAFGLLSKVF